MRTLLIGLFAALAGSAAHAQAPACAPVPGVEALWAKLETRFVLFGELHGTTEIPAFFADVVCHASGTGRSVRVALELEPEEQASLNAFFGGGSTFRFTRVGEDGRRSRAVVSLIEALGRMKAAGRDIEVVAARPSRTGPTQSAREHAMAEAWREQALGTPGALVLALVGNTHALKTRSADMPFTPAAAFLPPESTLSLITTFPGGESWVCYGEAPCGITRLRAAGSPLPRGIRLEGGPDSDGVFSVGRPFTASQPAVLPTP